MNRRNFYYKIQKILYHLFYFLIKKNNKTTIEWVIGVEEVANIINMYSSCLNNVVTINCSKHIFYDNEYTYNFYPLSNRYLNKIKKIFYPPFLFALLVIKAEKFIYLSSKGFFFEYGNDEREFEFSELKKKNKKIYCIFTGTDIRSLRLQIEYGDKKNIETIAHYMQYIDPYYISEKFEKKIKKICNIVDKYCDFLINPPIDQISYFKKNGNSFLYPLDDSMFSDNDDKFKKMNVVRILHAPSNPFVKGTQAVRAIIKMLKFNGYEFEYKELIKVSHSVILKELKETHIVLNEFYAFVPGVFGIEALANNCCLLTSADEGIEYTLPVDANKAWIVTKTERLYDNIKFLLENTKRIEIQANQGYQWCKKNYSKKYFTMKLKDLIE